MKDISLKYNIFLQYDSFECYFDFILTSQQRLSLKYIDDVFILLFNILIYAYLWECDIWAQKIEASLHANDILIYQKP